MEEAEYGYDTWTKKVHAMRTEKRIGELVPSVIFKTRVKNQEGEFVWDELTSYELFGDRNVIIFALPGAFTPTCSDFQLPGYDLNYEEFRNRGIDEIYCVSMNDAFVMNAWCNSMNIQNVQLLPDGNGDFTNKMGMTVEKENLGFGSRSWRYAAIVRNGRIEAWFEEPGFSNNCETDPYGESSSENLLKYLDQNNS